MPITTPKMSNLGSDEAKAKFESKLKGLELQAKEKETAQKGAALGVPHINLKGFPISPEALVLIAKEQALEAKVIPFLYSGDEVRLGVIDPASAQAKETAFQIAERVHGNIKTYIISENSFEIGLKLYDTLPKIRKIVKGVEISEAELKKYDSQLKTYKDLDALITKVQLTESVGLIMAAALKAGSSDIHIEAEEKDIVVRLRIDGVLNDAARMPAAIWPRVIGRIKLVSALKINVTSVPQDGRFTIFVGGEKIDVRVSTIPTAYGESVVMRLLKPSTIGLSFDQLGIRGRAYEQLKREIERPNGMIITTGPTGSGKTTTLYAVLKKLNDAETKIITLEDPVEYKLEGINQSPIDLAKDYTFAKGLRSILRQDPDVLMVGEIRDIDTAETAIQAALTGHLVISTIHTNDAAGAIPRFLSMGVKPFLLAPALNAVIGQRLVRRIHEACKIEDPLDEEKLKKVKDLLAKLSPNSGHQVDLNNLKFYKGKGCPECDNLGYKGRLGIYEVFTMGPEIEKLILTGNVSEYQMAEIALQQGMITMAQDGILKALDGITSVEEVLSVAE